MHEVAPNARRSAAHANVHPSTDHPLPSGPEDSTPSCTVALTTVQLARLQELDPSHTVELERRGDAWVRLRVLSPDGEIFQEADMPPL